jgi:2-keto-4-pentenoate hydratase/2-oxohepta-3-ene-1,7-dioic acid hydratase in catechol pathway
MENPSILPKGSAAEAVNLSELRPQITDILKLVTFRTTQDSVDTSRLGALLQHGNVFDLSAVSSLTHLHGRTSDMVKFIEGGAEAVSSVKLVLSSGQLPAEHVFSVDAVKILAPIPRPHRNVLCVGKNYQDHIAEVAAVWASKDPQQSSAPIELPKYAQLFTKAPQCVIATGETIQSHSAITKWLDYEAELAVIIGKQGVNIERENAWDHVFGFTIANDVTARDIQKQHTQFFKGKTLDTTCPMGPYIVPSSDMSCEDLSIKLWVNGELRQNSTTKNMIFDVPEIIRQLSAGFTLYPGDIILTGTPEGVGFAMKPPQALQPGDCIDIEIECLGKLSNVVH